MSLWLLLVNKTLLREESPNLRTLIALLKPKQKNKINRKKEYKKNTRRAIKVVFETTVIEFLQITV